MNFENDAISCNKCRDFLLHLERANDTKMKLREDIQKKWYKEWNWYHLPYPPPPYLKSEKQKNEIFVCLRPPSPSAKSEKFGGFKSLL